ncbi:MAG: sulfatase-like hydrolase/transferase, partial [Deltaproteobacteria bacterium]|nr:sulfatase-like hydrolase/transferase [Deltaproteobacteria bacterium]
MHTGFVQEVVSTARALVAALSVLLACCDPFTASTAVEARDGPPNVIIISMDTLRADHLGCYGYHRDTSVNIDELAERGVRFDSMSSTSAWTSPAHGSLFASRYPAQLGIVTFDGRKKARSLKQGEVMLAEILRDAGYETQAFTGGGYVSRKLGFGQGFDEYRDLKALQGYLADLMLWLDER